MCFADRHSSVTFLQLFSCFGCCVRVLVIAELSVGVLRPSNNSGQLTITPDLSTKEVEFVQARFIDAFTAQPRW